jgi:hypothetical protein
MTAKQLANIASIAATADELQQIGFSMIAVYRSFAQPLAAFTCRPN